MTNTSKLAFEIQSECWGECQKKHNSKYTTQTVEFTHGELVYRFHVCPCWGLGPGGIPPRQYAADTLREMGYEMTYQRSSDLGDVRAYQTFRQQGWFWGYAKRERSKSCCVCGKRPQTCEASLQYQEAEDWLTDQDGDMKDRLRLFARSYAQKRVLNYCSRECCLSALKDSIHFWQAIEEREKEQCVFRELKKLLPKLRKSLRQQDHEALRSLRKEFQQAASLPQ